jgi:hypothetical protein
LIRGSSKARHIANHAPTKRNQRGFARVLFFQQGIENLIEGFPVFVLLTVRKNDNINLFSGKSGSR